MVIDVRGDVVRLGITAPQTTQIWRKELWDVIVEENRVAAEAAKRSVSKGPETPQLPVSTFSRLSKIPTVHPGEKDDGEQL